MNKLEEFYRWLKAIISIEIKPITISQDRLIHQLLVNGIRITCINLVMLNFIAEYILNDFRILFNLKTLLFQDMEDLFQKLKQIIFMPKDFQIWRNNLLAQINLQKICLDWQQQDSM